MKEKKTKKENRKRKPQRHEKCAIYWYHYIQLFTGMILRDYLQDQFIKF